MKSHFPTPHSSELVSRGFLPVFGDGPSVMENTETEKIPEDVIVSEILTKLPAKSLLRFKSVRKSWYSSIQNPKFVEQFLNNSLTRPNLLLSLNNNGLSPPLLFTITLDDGNERNIKTPMKRFVKLDNEIMIRISPSVNGIFCIHPPSYQAGPVSIFNPTTRETVSLPRLPGDPDRGELNAVYYGFGFDPVKRVYKVMSFCHSDVDFVFKEGAEVECDILTLGGANSWRKVNCVSPIDFKPSAQGVCVNGAIHWLDGYKRGILAFDLGFEVFRVIPLPSGIYSDNEIELKEPSLWLCLVQVGGFLALVKCNYIFESRMYVLMMYVLKDYQNQEWALESKNYPEDWEMGNALAYGSTRTGEVFLELTHKLWYNFPATIVWCDMRREIPRTIEFPEEEVVPIDCYHENIMPLPRNDPTL